MFYRGLVFLTRILGTWVFGLVAQGIAAGYFCFAPRRVRVGVRFYRALFPQRSRVYALWCTWRQFRNFTSVYLDRFRAAGARGHPATPPRGSSTSSGPWMRAPAGSS